MKSSETLSAEFFDLLIEKGPALRKAGYAHLQLGDVHITLHPHQVEYAAPKSEDLESTDPLDDPYAYGLGPGEKLPWSDGSETAQ